MTSQSKAYLYAGITVMLWSTVASAFKIALQDLDYIQVLFISAIVSMFSLLVVMLLQGKINELIHPSLSGLSRSAMLGLLNPLFYYLVLFKAYDLLPAQEAQPLNWTWPIMLTLFSAILLKQRITARILISVMLCFGGVLIISTRGNFASWHFSNPLGVLLAIGSSVLWALYWIFNLKDPREPVVKLFWNFLFGCIYSTVALFLISEIPDPFQRGFSAAIWVGFFEMGIAFIIWLKALSLSHDSASVGIFAYMTPFISLIFIYFILGEKILLSSVTGLVLIVGGIGLQTLWRKA